MTRSTSRDAQRGAAANARRRADERLREALEATFPGSDALALALDEDPSGRATFASPPCFMHELDRAYLGLEPPSRASDPSDSAAQCDGAGARGADDSGSVTRRPEGPDGR